ncbi:hypothetical protein V5H05_09235 [Vibrio cholerae]|uniref:hypothetical protein n=1 Tax=Vibrio TaxID=662 RepID=UPI000BA92CF5|nr:hypothetical protein [Vibrio metoecus]PAR35857.1 hypothetical protein CGT97_09845 [Vibrio metoecus]PAR40429.1 hypothetical protein CGT96_17820 [Vibrio metoecus]
MNRVASLHQKKGMPEYGVKVNLHGSDWLGNWTIVGELRPYKQLPFKKSPPHRFVDAEGKQIKFVEHWSPIHEEKQ